MNEKEDHSLIVQPAAAVEKAAAGAKRILTGMVADTLALAKKEPSRKSRPLRIVQVNDETCVNEVFDIVIRDRFPDATVLSFDNAAAALEELSKTKADLLITDDKMAKMNGEDLCRRLLARKVTYPIIVDSPWEPTEEWVREFAKQGLNVSFLPLPCDIASLRNLVEAALKLPGCRSEQPVEMAGHRAPAPSVDAEALLQQGKDFYFAIGVPKSYAEAFAWFSKAAAAGHAEAQFHVALCFEDGDGVKPDQAQAVEWYRKSATGGFAKAQNNLAICYGDGQGVPRDYAEAEKWYCRAAEQGYAPASCRPEDSVPSKVLDRMGCDYRYRFGHGAPHDGAEAVKWYRIEAERGCTDAQTNLGVCYEFGHGVPQDYAEAGRWYRMAAEQGCADAQNKLIVGIQSGRIVPLYSDERWKWFLREETSRCIKPHWKGAERGKAEDQCLLGLCFEKGIGFPQDSMEAYKWLKLAAAQHHEKAARRLSSLSSTMAAYQKKEGERRYREFKARVYQGIAMNAKSDFLSMKNEPAGTSSQLRRTAMNGRRKILHCDDDPDLLDMYREILGSLPSQPEVRRANRGPLALAMLEAEPFDLLICDLKMPKMDGFQVLEIVRRECPELRTMIFTEEIDEQFRDRAYALGADLYWHKPGTEQETKLWLEQVQSLLSRESGGSLPKPEYSAPKEPAVAPPPPSQQNAELKREGNTRPTLEPEQVQPPKPLGRMRPRRIVMLDDEPVLLRAYEIILESWFPDADILTFTDAVEALADLERQDPDLFTTDWNHPKAHGHELLAILAARKVKFPIFVISAFGGWIEHNDVLRPYLSQGLNVSVLDKPWTVEDVRLLLSRHFSLEPIAPQNQP